MELPDNFSFIDEHVAGSAYPYTRAHSTALRELGITDIITLTPGKPELEKILKIHHFPSLGTPHRENIEEILQIIDQVIGKGGKVLVHCQYGSERTGIILASYLMKKENISIRQAIKILHQRRKQSLKSYSSIQYLLELYDQ